jgi:hypothetical protein
MSRFILNLQICKEQDTVQILEPAFINDKLVETVSTMIGYFLEQELENHNIQADEERFREYVVEIAYRVILHEMTHVRQLRKKGKQST